MAFNDAKTIRADVLINSVKVPVSSLTFTHTIDELPQVSFNIQLDNRDSQATEIDLPLFVKLTRERQEYLVNKFRTTLNAEQSLETGLKPDLQIALEDGDKNILNFIGFLSRPNMTVQGGQLTLRYNGVQQNAAMQNFNVNLYPATEIYVLKQLTLPQGANESFNSIGTRTDAIVKQILDEINLGIDTNFENYGELSQTHNMNTAVYNKYIAPFLALSKPRTLLPLVEDLEAALDTAISINPAARANQTIFRALYGAANFFGVIQELKNQFKLQMNSTWDGDTWMEVIRMHEEPAGRKITAPLQNIVVDVAASVESPLSRVYVRVGNVGLYGLSDMIRNENTLRQMGAFPPFTREELEGGVRQVVGVAYVADAPSWVTDVNAIQSETTPLDTSDLSLTGSVSKFRELEGSFRDQLLNRGNLLNWLAEYTYREHFLKYTKTVVTIPLATEVQPGLTYSIYSPEGTHIFDGYLASCSHHVSLEETTGRALTTLSFTHVKMANAQFRDLSLGSTIDQAVEESDLFTGADLGNSIVDVQV